MTVILLAIVVILAPLAGAGFAVLYLLSFVSAVLARHEGGTP